MNEGDHHYTMINVLNSIHHGQDTSIVVSTIDQVSNSKSFSQTNIKFHRFYKWIIIIIADSMKYCGEVWILLVELMIVPSFQPVYHSQNDFPGLNGHPCPQTEMLRYEHQG